MGTCFSLRENKTSVSGFRSDKLGVIILVLQAGFGQYGGQYVPERVIPAK